MAQNLAGKRVAVVATDGFEQVELTSPLEALRSAGAEAHIVSPNPDRVQGWRHSDKADFFDVDVPIERARAEDYDALLLPGGVKNPDKLRRNEAVLKFVRGFFEQHKPVAAICHGPWTLIDAEVVKGRRMTSYHSIQTDLKNAGAEWTDQEVVVDRGLITSRHPNDLEAFNRKFLEEIAKGPQA